MKCKQMSAVRFAPADIFCYFRAFSGSQAADSVLVFCFPVISYLAVACFADQLGHGPHGAVNTPAAGFEQQKSHALPEESVTSNLVCSGR